MKKFDDIDCQKESELYEIEERRFSIIWQSIMGTLLGLTVLGSILDALL
jgi:hypothetical protein